MKTMFAHRKKAMVWTDKRARLIGELLASMRVLKFFGSFPPSFRSRLVHMPSCISR